MSPPSAMERLAETLKANRVDAEPRAVASAILDLARLDEWSSHPERIMSWILDLALDMTRELRPTTRNPAR